MKTIVWFRQDLRLADNEAITYAAASGSVIPLYILDPTDRSLGGASKWWLHHSLETLQHSLGGLVIEKGEPLTVLRKLCEKTGAQAISWNRVYEPHAVKRDQAIKSHFNETGFEAKSFPGSVLLEPWELMTGAGEPYKVYSPFWRAILKKGVPAPAKPCAFRLADVKGLGVALSDLRLLPKNPNWAKGWEALWHPGESGARTALKLFLDQGIKGYGELRNRPDLSNISRLSPHIHFGEISPRQLFARSSITAHEQADLAGDIHKFQSEIAWRDFANHLLFHFPGIPMKNWKPHFDHYPWKIDPKRLQLWKQGMTGYPMVDAGMRELWNTGYMHNRVRMLVASFLVKHLRIHWREGEAWFWDTLLDADLANNSTSWQWVTGSGADAAPYFRIFNPFTQGKKFDPEGHYVRKWCPELATLPNQYIHAPHEAPAEVLEQASIKLGRDYPLPIVDHKNARQAALAGFEVVKGQQA